MALLNSSIMTSKMCYLHVLMIDFIYHISRGLSLKLIEKVEVVYLMSLTGH